mgnify:CR=1 FL=1
MDKGRVLQQIDYENYCVCPIGELPGQGEGPTTESFETQVKERIASMKNAGNAISIVSSADYVIEGQPVICNGEIRSFQSFVYADIGIDARSLSNETKDNLQSVFQESYNSLSFGSCDEFFRVVSEVSLTVLTEVPGRRLQDNSSFGNSSSGNAEPDRGGQAVFQITGNCRSCQGTSLVLTSHLALHFLSRDSLSSVTFQCQQVVDLRFLMIRSDVH